MKKTLSVIVISFIIGSVIAYSIFTFYTSQAIRKNVLSQLEKELKFCEIVHDDISFGIGKFWLWCNGRPFYTEYVNNSLTYKKNGWGFLQKLGIWNDVSNCDFLSSKKEGNGCYFGYGHYSSSMQKAIYL